MKNEIQVPFSKSVQDRHIVYGVVYSPNMPDSQGDFMTSPEIEKMAHKFLSKGLVNRIDTNHNLLGNGSLVVESFIARKGDVDFDEGSWVLGVYIPDETTWDAVKSGDLNAFSMYGEGKREKATLMLEIPDSGIVKGSTMGDANGHSHEYVVRFDDNGQFVGGRTDETDGHSHQIKNGTITEASGMNGHTHRYTMNGV